jgi:hypothetical protein
MVSLQQLPDEDLQALCRKALALPDARAAWLRRATALAAGSLPTATVQAIRAAAGVALQHVLAALRFDSQFNPAMALGLRSASDSARHLLFSANGRDIDLRIVEVAERFAMTGQVLGTEGAGMVEATSRSDPGQGAAEAHVATLDDLGEFRFGGLRPGVFSITLRLGREMVHLPLIELGRHRV